MIKMVDHENIAQELSVKFSYDLERFRERNVELGDVVKELTNLLRGRPNEDVTGIQSYARPVPQQDGRTRMELTFIYASNKASVLRDLSEKVNEALAPFKTADTELEMETSSAGQTFPPRSRPGPGRGGSGSGRGLLN